MQTATLHPMNARGGEITVDTHDSGSCALSGRAGSSPAPGTTGRCAERLKAPDCKSGTLAGNIVNSNLTLPTMEESPSLVYGTGLLNQRTERCRGFKSPLLRHNKDDSPSI